MFDKNVKWEADAGNISNYKYFNSFVYKNGCVESFLSNESKSFIIAAKGMGKTLLLSYKRYLLENKNDSSSILFIPNQHPYLAFVESFKSTLSQEQISKLQGWEYCKRFWTLIIELSTISFVQNESNEFLKNLSERTKRYKSLLTDLVGKRHTIEYIFNEIIALNGCDFANVFYKFDKTFSNNRIIAKQH